MGTIDLINSFSERVTCGTKDFECEDASLCVPRHWTCDGENDCKDASDEDPKLCRTQSNASHDYKIDR